MVNSKVEPDEMEDQTLIKKNDDEGIFHTLIRPCLAEFFGDLIFIYLVCMTSNSPGSAIGVGLIIFVLIQGLGHISGGHFNPAVTLGVLLAQAITPKLAACYMLSQLFGAIMGAACYRGSVMVEVYNATLGGANSLTKSASLVVDPGQGVLIEMLLTTLLVLTVLMTAVDTKGQSTYAPLAIGLSISADALIGGAYTGASMNPARSLGPAIIYAMHGLGGDAWSEIYVYIIGPFLGSVLAGLVFRLFFADDDKRIIAARKAV